MNVWINRQGEFLVISEERKWGTLAVWGSFTTDLNKATVQAMLPGTLEFRDKSFKRGELIPLPARVERKVFIERRSEEAVVHHPEQRKPTPLPGADFKLYDYDVKSVVTTVPTNVVKVTHIPTSFAVTCDNHPTIEANHREALEELTRQVWACGWRPLVPTVFPEVEPLSWDELQP